MKKVFSFYLTVIVFLSACSTQQQEANVIILENHLSPVDVQLIGHDSLYAQKILDREALAIFLPQSLTDVDKNNWEDQGFIYVETLESSTCPKNIKEVSFAEEAALIDLQLEAQRDHCTDDAVTKLFLIQMNSDLIKKAEQIKLGDTLASFQEGKTE
ncbi:hypothetical protein [Halalkalibacter oceani]|uniref:Lipoprotein n=1 Tax=Halalkalibacter oceani TaxID=1653776 RepID=A0A9X2IMX0_9BACI|nr:hypothetical protein [Halalkalibacter oceani]MCM3713450.1 hypothetical protein [Halalkalibacter oceani]